MGSRSLRGREKRPAEICRKKCRASPGSSESSLEYSLDAVSCCGVACVSCRREAHAVLPSVASETLGLVSALLCSSWAGPRCSATETGWVGGAVLGLAAGARGGQSAGGCCWSERTVPATATRPLHDEGGSCGFLCLHAGWLRPQGSPEGEFEGASVQLFALCVAAVPLVKSDAEGAAAMLLDQVGGLNLRCSAGAGLFAFARLRAVLGFAASLAVFSFAFFAGRRL